MWCRGPSKLFTIALDLPIVRDLLSAETSILTRFWSTFEAILCAVRFRKSYTSMLWRNVVQAIEITDKAVKSIVRTVHVRAPSCEHDPSWTSSYSHHPLRSWSNDNRNYLEIVNFQFKCRYLYHSEFLVSLSKSQVEIIWCQITICWQIIIWKR